MSRRDEEEVALVVLSGQGDRGGWERGTQPREAGERCVQKAPRASRRLCEGCEIKTEKTSGETAAYEEG